MSYTSAHMENGYPGELKVSVVFTLTQENELLINYQANTDRKTILNLTNHSYFNLKGAGEGDILDHKLYVYADSFTAMDAHSVPTGEIRSVEGTPLDFREGRVIGADIDSTYDQMQIGKGYDHNFVLLKDEAHVAPEYAVHGLSISHAATLVSPEGDITMDVYTDRPGVQVYSGNYISGEDVGKGNVRYPYRGGFAIETQCYPNACNIDTFPSPLIEANKDVYLRTVYRFS